MQLRTTRFGEMDVDEGLVVEFDEGPLGFSDAHRFVVVAVDGSEDFFWLQSADDGELAFLATVPWPYFPDYAPELPEAVRNRLEIDDPAQATVLCLLTVDRDREQVHANLLGPIVINPRTRRGSQTVLYDQDWPLAAPLGGS